MCPLKGRRRVIAEVCYWYGVLSLRRIIVETCAGVRLSEKSADC